MHLVNTLIYLSIAIVLACSPVKATESGYILAELPSIPCQHLPSDDACASLDYKIPDLREIHGVRDVSEIGGNISSLALVFGLSGNETCSKSGTKYYCSILHPFRCEGDYVKVDVNKIVAMCTQGKLHCSSLNAAILNSLFNCSDVALGFSQQQSFKRNQTFDCGAFPEVKNDDYKCIDNYKVCNALYFVLFAFRL